MTTPPREYFELVIGERKESDQRIGFEWYRFTDENALARMIADSVFEPTTIIEPVDCSDCGDKDDEIDDLRDEIADLKTTIKDLRKELQDAKAKTP